MKEKKQKDRKKKRRYERVRRQKHHERSQLAQAQKWTPEPPEWEQEKDKDIEFDSTPLPPMLSMYTSERMHRAIARLAQQQNIETEEDYRSFLNSITGVPLDTMTEELELNPVEQAQELAFQALDKDDPREALSLAQEALELDPDCVDALTVVAGTTSQSAKEVIAKMQLAVEAGQRVLGREFFEENRGYFWGMVETRPYMRACASLAQLLLETEQTEEAIRHFEDMLELNPNDNQGVRDTLLGCYLMTDNLESALKLCEQYKEDSSAVFAWGRVLERFLAGEHKAAEKALREARKQNRYVEPYLAGKRRLPPVGPDSYMLGKESEAAHCARELGPAWASHPAAVEWLQESARGVKSS